MQNNLDSLTTEKSYSYQTLATASTIRLIRVSSERVNGNIRCTLHHVDTLHMQGLQYHALSYLWGDPKHTNRIYIGDPEGDAHLRHIHENLWQFLNYVWEQGKFGLFLWTDGLCLDQSNADEIAKQVPRMGGIYAAAEEVIVWLGHDQQGQDAMRLLTTRDRPESVDWSAEVGDEEYETWWENAISVEEAMGEMPETMEEMAAAAEHLLLLPYWSRVWIVQEVVLAKHVCVTYGSISLDLDEFCRKMNPFRDRKPEYDYQPTVWLLCEWRKGRRNKPLWSLIYDFELCERTLVLDRVYGFLGMAAKHDDGTSPTDHMEVSYDKRPFEVFYDMAFELLAPWDKYPGILLSLRKLLFCGPGEAGPDHDDVRRLEEYARGSRTSNRHARFADLALLVLDAANAIIPFMVPNFQEWTKAARALLKSATQSRLKPTLHQNAAVVGLVLTVLHEELHSSWKAYDRESKMGDELPRSSGWRCAAHRDEGYPIISKDLQECSQAQFTLDASLVTKACGRHSRSCNRSMMSFEIPEIGFRLIITPDTGREVAESLPLKALPAIFSIQAESSEFRESSHSLSTSISSSG